MIRFDRTQRSIVAVCGCGARDVFTNQAAADAWALAHIYTAHPEPTAEHMRAITAGRVRRHRATP